MFISVTRHVFQPKVRSRNSYRAISIERRSLRASVFKKPLRASASISPLYTSIVTQRNLSRRRSRCRRMRSAAAERFAIAAIDGVVVISAAVLPNVLGIFLRRISRMLAPPLSQRSGSLANVHRDTACRDSSRLIFGCGESVGPTRAYMRGHVPVYTSKWSMSPPAV